MKKIIILVWALLTAIITICSLSPDISPTESYHLDKIVHGGAYAGLAFLAFIFTNNYKYIIILLVVIIALGGVIEILQNYIPGRSGTIGDFSADFIGALAGAAIAYKIKPAIKNRFKL